VGLSDILGLNRLSYACVATGQTVRV